jgi:hypothetical protein
VGFPLVELSDEVGDEVELVGGYGAVTEAFNGFELGESVPRGREEGVIPVLEAEMGNVQFPIWGYP